jgi:chemotaxis protein methyltransferase CheR
MTEDDFGFLRVFLQRRSGLALTVDKRYLVDNRLQPLCRRLGLAGIGPLVLRLRAGRDPELERLVIEAMTTNETFFFRDRTPFELFRDVLVPRFLGKRAASRRLRIWCAAASTGQEPYSLAMIVKSLAPKLGGWNIEIVATDLSVEVIDRAKAGIYSQLEVQRGLPVQLLLKHFTQVGETWQIVPELRAMVQFMPLNLLRDFSTLGTFDVVLCRNVLIYLGGTMKANVLERVADRMAGDAALILGSAETVIGLTDALMPDPVHHGLYVRSVRRAAVPDLRVVANAY